jgi:hypothetical protein
MESMPLNLQNGGERELGKTSIRSLVDYYDARPREIQFD